MKKLFALFTFTALAACSSNSNPMTSAVDDEEISSSNSFETEEISSSSQLSSSQMSSSSSEEISSSSEEEIQSSMSKVVRTCIVDKLSYAVVHMSEQYKPYIVIARNKSYTEWDEAACEIFTTFVTPQNDTLHYQTYVDVGVPASISVPLDLTQSTINLVHVVRKCYDVSTSTVAEFDSDCVLTSF